ncbi:MAG: hypothetical protein Tsb005_19230 [Gammaproteobacteria bacterium]
MAPPSKDEAKKLVIPADFTPNNTTLLIQTPAVIENSDLSPSKSKTRSHEKYLWLAGSLFFSAYVLWTSGVLTKGEFNKIKEQVLNVMNKTGLSFTELGNILGAIASGLKVLQLSNELRRHVTLQSHQLLDGEYEKRRQPIKALYSTAELSLNIALVVTYAMSTAAITPLYAAAATVVLLKNTYSALKNLYQLNLFINSYNLYYGYDVQHERHITLYQVLTRQTWLDNCKDEILAPAQQMNKHMMQNFRNKFFRSSMDVLFAAAVVVIALALPANPILMSVLLVGVSVAWFLARRYATNKIKDAKLNAVETFEAAKISTNNNSVDDIQKIDSPKTELASGTTEKAAVKDSVPVLERQTSFFGLGPKFTVFGASKQAHVANNCAIDDMLVHQISEAPEPIEIVPTYN